MDMIATTFDIACSFRGMETAFRGSHGYCERASVVGDLSGAWEIRARFSSRTDGRFGARISDHRCPLGAPPDGMFFNDRSPLESLASCQHDVGCGGGRHMGGALIAQGREIEAVQEMLAGPEQPWRDRHVQIVDESRFEVMAERRHAAADLHI